eukprot:768678-Pleurochrysis_carterae.AAC.1
MDGAVPNDGSLALVREREGGDELASHQRRREGEPCADGTIEKNEGVEQARRVHLSAFCCEAQDGEDLEHVRFRSGRAGVGAHELKDADKGRPSAVHTRSEEWYTRHCDTPLCGMGE